MKQTIIEFFDNKNEVAAVYLFGSFASGKEKPFSDIDIAILFKTTNKQDQSRYRDQYLVELSRLLRKDIHFIILNNAGETVLKQILVKGICLLDKDPCFLSRFKAVAISKITEFSYYNDVMKRGFLRSMVKGIPDG